MRRNPRAWKMCKPTGHLSRSKLYGHYQIADSRVTTRGNSSGFHQGGAGFNHGPPGFNQGRNFMQGSGWRNQGNQYKEQRNQQPYRHPSQGPKSQPHHPKVLGFHSSHDCASWQLQSTIQSDPKGRDRERQIIVQIMKSISSIKPFYCALKTTICYELLTSRKSWEKVCVGKKKRKQIYPNNNEILSYLQQLFWLMITLLLVFSYRASENIFGILPSLNDVKDALSEANSWLRNSKPYLVSSTCASNSVRKVEDLSVSLHG